jgi:hypothetical protein
VTDRLEKELVEKAILSASPSNGGWWRAACPVCASMYGKDDKKKALGFFPETGFYHCFRCEIRGHLHGDFEGYLGTEQEPVENNEAIQPPEGYMLLTEEPARSAYVAEPARKYLLKRRVAETTWKQACIGITLEGKQRNRIVVPLLDKIKLEWTGWVARDWTNKSYLPYIYPKGFNRETQFWNQEALYVQTSEPVLVMEGVFDALPYYPTAVACLGKPTHAQFPLLLEATRPIVVVLDGDAWEIGRALAMRLALKGKVCNYLRLPPKTDPNEVDTAWLIEEAYKKIDGQKLV